MYRSRGLFVAVSTGALLCGHAHAQEASSFREQVEAPTPDEASPEQANQGDDIVVTGSLIRRRDQRNSASPLAQVGREDLAAVGATDLAVIANTLTVNTGSNNQPDAFSQGFTTGTSNFNLRGLGLGSTLVLVNGRRQVLYGVPNDEGASFVDTNSLVPLIAVERAEILKDGAAALYGSDAVAGVVNFITRRGFTGLEINSNYQAQLEHGARDVSVSAVYGVKSDRGRALFAVEYLDRTSLNTDERRFPGSMIAYISSFGSPGRFLVPRRPTGPNQATIDAWSSAYDRNNNGVADFFESPRPAGAAAPSLADPDCAAGAPTSTPPANGITGNCTFDFGLFYNLIPDEQRLLGYAEFSYELADAARVFGEISFANNDATRRNSPSFPALSGAPVSAVNPFNPYGVDVVWLGRVLGSGAEAAISTHDNDTFRVVGGIDGDVGRWFYEVTGTHAASKAFTTTPDTLRQPLLDAVRTGLFNPFGSALTAPAGDPRRNEADVFDRINGRLTTDVESEPNVVNAYATGPIFANDGRDVSIAVGAQFRDEKLSQTVDNDGRLGNYLFLVGRDPFDISRGVWAVFAEASIPLFSNLDLSAAVRHEDYDGPNSTTDPKVSLLFRPTEWLSVRGSWGTSFRAPSLVQAGGNLTSLQNLTDPVTRATAFKPATTRGNPDLRPETAETWNIGATAEGGGFNVSVDYRSFDFEDIIVRESPAAVLIAAPNGPQVIRDVTTGQLLRVEARFVNASALKTSGIDLSLGYSLETSRMGTFRGTLDGTYALEYDLTDPLLGQVDGAGNRNFNNFGTSVPELRLNAGLTWTLDAHTLNAFVRFTDSYRDDQNANRLVESFTTVDVQYALDLSNLFGSSKPRTLAIGLINAFDEDPPFVITNGGYDSKVRDPRGRLGYVRFTAGF